MYVLWEPIYAVHCSQLQEGLAQVLGLLKAQQQEVNNLHLAVQEQQDQQSQFQKQVQEQQQLQQVAMATSAPNMDEQLGKLENVMGSRVERLLTHHAQRESILCCVKSVC